MKSPAKAARAWIDGTFRQYIATLISTMSWRVAIALALVLSRTVTQGAQLALLVPLMQIVGLDVQGEALGPIADFMESAFGFFGLSLTLGSVLIAFVAFTTLVTMFGRWQMNYDFALEQDFVAILRRRLYRAIANARWLTLSKSRSSDFTHALTTELDRVGAATGLLLQMVSSAVMVLVYLVFAIGISPAMTAAVFAGGFLLLFTLRKKTQQAQWTGEDITLATNGLYSAAMEHLSGIKTAKSYGAEERSADIFSELSDRVARMYINSNVNFTDTSFWFTVGSVVVLSAILFVSFEILGVSAAALLLLLFLFNRMIPMLSGMQNSYQQYVNALPAFAGVMAMQSRCEAAAETAAKTSGPALELREELRFDGVSFAYEEGSEPSVRGLDLAVKAGQTTAVVGPSGAGKSTFADLVMGLILPDEGRISVDGETLDPDRVRRWRDGIGYVAQDAFMFNDTVRANLLWAAPGASEGQIARALEMAAAGFVFDFPDGLEATLGERGVRLSGGERQRLSLARALLREPSLLILDEATSSLDSENERRIQEAIESLHGRTTILVITHRLSTIRDADVIHVLEGGRLVESGGWEGLLEEDGRFGDLCRAQGIRAGGIC